MKTAAFAVALVLTNAVVSEAHAECAGKIHGFWEKRGLESASEFKVIEEFRIDRETGMLSVCDRDRTWDAKLWTGEADMSIVFARRERTLRLVNADTFLSPSWVAEFEGVKSEYRVRVQVAD